jgi:hypothetical protein
MAWSAGWSIVICWEGWQGVKARLAFGRHYRLQELRQLE